MEKIYKNGLKKCYISGPMTGIEDLNRKEFEEAQKRLTYFGFEAVNPHTIHPTSFMEEIERKIKSKEISEERAWEIFMKRDIEVLMRCELIMTLNGWHNSKGARLEIFSGVQVGMMVFSAHTLEEIIIKKQVVDIHSSTDGTMFTLSKKDEKLVDN